MLFDVRMSRYKRHHLLARFYDHRVMSGIIFYSILSFLLVKLLLRQPIMRRLILQQLTMQQLIVLLTRLLAQLRWAFIFLRTEEKNWEIVEDLILFVRQG